MKQIYLILLFLILPSVFATSIAISPPSIEINEEQTNNSFILMNPNNQDINFSIKSTSADILLEEISGIIKANSNKRINFQTSSLKQDSYIIISFESSNSIAPALTLKLIKKYQEETQQEQVQIKQETAIQENKPQTPKENYNFIYISIAIGVLLLILLFPVYNNKKYRIGHTGQALRIFIRRLLH